jgi:hypothetical protein
MQICRYTAKFRLLDYGLLDAALGVDELERRLRKEAQRMRDAKNEGRKKSKTRKGNSMVDDEAASGEESEESEEDGEMDVNLGDDGDLPEDETIQEFASRVDQYVNIHLQRASSSKRDSYKDSLVYQTRKELINEFLKAAIRPKCNNEDCGW